MDNNIQNNNPTTSAPTPTPPTEDSPNSTVRILITIVVLLIVTSIGGFIWFVSQGLTLGTKSEPVVADISYSSDLLTDIPQQPRPLGELYLTLTPKSGGYTDSYIYDFDNRTIKQINDAPDPVEHITMFNSFNADGTKQVFFETTAENLKLSASLGKSVMFDLIYSDKVSGHREIIARVANPKGSASVNDSYSVLYTSRTIVATDRPPQANDWTIYLTNRDDSGKWTSRELWVGSSPKWISDNIFYYLKNGGIYIGIVGIEKEERVWSTDGVLGGNSNLAISRDRHKLAWTLPDSGHVYIFSNKYDIDKEYFVLTAENVIHVNAFWAAFSPDGNKIALQTANWNTLRTDPRPRIEIYSIREGSNKQLGIDDKILDIDLDNFVQTGMFLTDWR